MEFVLASPRSYNKYLSSTTTCQASLWCYKYSSELSKWGDGWRRLEETVSQQTPVQPKGMARREDAGTCGGCVSCGKKTLTTEVCREHMGSVCPGLPIFQEKVETHTRGEHFQNSNVSHYSSDINKTLGGKHKSVGLIQSKFIILGGSLVV